MTTMAALRAHRRGGPENLVFEQAPMPDLGDHDVLIAVHAAAITFTELHWDETWSHVPTIPSHEFSGVVHEIGAAVTRWRPGDEVYALVRFELQGAAAEFVAVPEADLAAKPITATHVQAATLPLAALTAWQGLFDVARLQAGQRLLVLGGAGGVGGFATQLGHNVGAHVTATVRDLDADHLRRLGADEVIDRSREPLAGSYDVVFDTVGGADLEAAYTLLPHQGRLVTLQAPPDSARAAATDVEASFFIVHPDHQQLSKIASLVDEGALRSNIAAVFPLDRGRQAFESGADRPRSPGKTVLVVRS